MSGSENDFDPLEEAVLGDQFSQIELSKSLIQLS